MAKRDVTYIISVVDRASAGFRKIAEGSRKARREVEGLEEAAEDTGKSIEVSLSDDTVKALSEALTEAKHNTKELGEEARASGRGFEGMAKSAKGMVKAIAAAAVTKFFVKQGKAAVGAAAQMESYEATLETMLGSSQAARERMEEYKDVARITPFEMSEVVEAGNQLQAIGRYSRENLEMLGDLAAATGKPMEQVMNAYAKLATGQKGEAARMFQDLLISRQDWVAATGKGVSKSGELLATTEEMMKALPKIMSKKGYYGMMAKQAEKANGMFSNLEDSVFSLRAAIGERMLPTVKRATEGLSKMTGSMERAAKTSLPEKIAQEKTELNLLVGALGEAWTKEDQKGRLLDEITGKYPEFLKGIDLEKEGLQGVKDKLVEVNAEYDKKIEKAYIAARLATLDEEVDKKYGALRDRQMAKKAKERNEEIAQQFGGEWESPIDFDGTKMKIGARMATSYLGMAKYDPKKGLYYYRHGGKKEYIDESYNSLIEEYQSNEKRYIKPLHVVNTSDKKLAELEHEYEAKMAERDNLLKLAGVNVGPEGPDAEQPGGTTGGTDDGGGSTGGTTVGGTTYSGGGYGSGSGGGSGKTVTTNIGTLVGTIEIHTTTLQESEEEVKRIITQALLEAVPSDL